MQQLTDHRDAVIRLDAVRVWTAEGAHLLNEISWTVRTGEHWAILGPNGAGKSTLLSVVAANRFPSSGSVELLGGRLGYIEIRTLRKQIGIVDPSIRLLDWMTVEEIVLTGATGTVRLLPNMYSPADADRARELTDPLPLAL
jgi:iron complex transport system ATP-binding protein